MIKGYQVMCGYENLIFGAAIPGLGGANGIMRGDSRLNYTQEGGMLPKGNLATPSEDSDSCCHVHKPRPKKLSFLDKLRQLFNLGA